MTSPNPTPINLYNAGLFSALAYAPDGLANANSMAWALSMPGSYVYQDANTLGLMGWTDITATALNIAGLSPNSFENVNSESAFHVFQNTQTDQIVFVFRGSTPPTL